jgi:hypothetical protein
MVVPTFVEQIVVERRKFRIGCTQMSCPDSVGASDERPPLGFQKSLDATLGGIKYDEIDVRKLPTDPFAVGCNDPAPTHDDPTVWSALLDNLAGPPCPRQCEATRDGQKNRILCDEPTTLREILDERLWLDELSVEYAGRVSLAPKDGRQPK